MTLGSWRAAPACGMWLWWPCRPRRGPTWRGARVGACCWHTDCRGQGRSIPPELPQPACHDETMWPSGRSLRTSDPWGRMRLYGRKLRSVSLYRRPSIQTVSKTLATSRKTAPVSLFSPKFLVILSTRRASCNDVLCLGLNPNCSSSVSPRSFTTCKILVSSIFSNNLPIVSTRLIGR